MQFKPAFTYAQIVTGISKLLFSLQFISRKVDDLRKTVIKYYILRNTLKAPVKKEAWDFQAAFSGCLGAQDLVPDAEAS